MLPFAFQKLCLRHELLTHFRIGKEDKNDKNTVVSTSSTPTSLGRGSAQAQVELGCMLHLMYFVGDEMKASCIVG